MCHLLLVLPLVALVAFWIWPLWIAAPVYAIVAAVSVAFYLQIVRTMSHPPEVGVDELLRETGEVVASDGTELRVVVRGEHWNARSPDSLRVGDRVRVTGIRGMTLTVRRTDADPYPPPPPEAAEGLASQASTTSR